MKKIIYSLVIMIAAGSLFTSCIDQLEPVGILDMRTAKAEYIRALKELRAADAEYRRAEAALMLAHTAYRQAEAAWMQEKVNEQKLFNELQALYNEAQAMDNEQKAAEVANRIDELTKGMEQRELEHAIRMTELEGDLATAENQLRIILRDIELSCQDLTQDEKMAVQAAVDYYWRAYTEVAEQSMEVLKAQRKLDSLKSVLAVGADVYDKPEGAYIGEVEQWKRQIEFAEKIKARLIELLEEAPDSLNYADVDTWKAEIDEMVADSAALEYSKYAITKEIANYYVNYVHDGVKKFNNEAEAWNKKNPEPAYTKAQQDLVKAGEKKQEDFAKAPLKDSIIFPIFEKNDEISKATFDKFVYLLKSYDQKSPYNEESNLIVLKTGTNDTLVIKGPVKQEMKDFILGYAGANVLKGTFNKKNLTANYGLKGALDVLERELVTEKAKAPDVEKLLEALDLADSTWEAHRQILIDGVAAFKPFTDTIALYEAAQKKAVEDQAKLLEAVKTLYTYFDALTGEASWKASTDSVNVVRAIEAFASVRDSYLNDETEYAKGKNPHYFYFAAESKLGEPVVDSVLFSEIASQTKFPAASYQFDTKNKRGDGWTVRDGSGLTDDGIYWALCNIIGQLTGKPADAKTAIDKATIGDLKALLGELIPGSKVKYTVDSWSDPKELKADGTAYTEPKAVTDLKAAVVRSANEYLGVYKAFWAVEISIDAAEFTAYFNAVKDNKNITKEYNALTKAIMDKNTLKRDPECYTKATFHLYSDEKISPLVVMDGTNIIFTPALGVVLGSVDPGATNVTGECFNESGHVRLFASSDPASAIFLKGETDFYKVVKALYDYWKAITGTVEKDLEILGEWIDDVETAFVADATKDDGKAGYDAWKKDYDAAVKAKDAHEAWATKAEAYTGAAVPARKITGTYADPESITWPNKFEMAALLEAPAEGYSGEWKAKIGDKKFGGEQVTLLNTIFPDFPKKLKEWYDALDAVGGINDQLKHYKILLASLRDAYFAAAKAAGENVGDAANWDQLVKNYTEANKNHRKVLVNLIKDAQKLIDDNTKNIADFEHGKPMLEIAVAQAETDLAVAQSKLAVAEKALDYAKANLDRVMDYMKSLDANFLNGSDLDFPWHEYEAI